MARTVTKRNVWSPSYCLRFQTSGELLSPPPGISVKANVIAFGWTDLIHRSAWFTRCSGPPLAVSRSSATLPTVSCIGGKVEHDRTDRLITRRSSGFEIMELQPPEPTLCQLESKSIDVIGQSWQKRLDSVFLENLGKHRKYDSRSLRDLLRALRNKASGPDEDTV